MDDPNSSQTPGPAHADAEAANGETVYAVSYPPAMYARDILNNRAIATAMGYGWLHDDDTPFARRFREQVKRQAELYQQWLDQD